MDDELLRIPPPIHTEDPASPPPASILLDSYGYLSCRVNGTTAEGFTRGGESVLVTFWAATHPWFGDLPTALYSEDDLVLLRLPIRRQDDRLHADYFVHQAGTNNNPPSLKLLPPIPRGVSFSDREIVLLRCRDQDTFYFALLHTSLKVWWLQQRKRRFQILVRGTTTGRRTAPSIFLRSQWIAPRLPKCCLF
uniref:DUF1618 domain-containing protein n=1 Tax=Setaria viridis TaxID=4556 RepID=A0A4U6W4I7_SETVI|nr:hypothetical protein SEVIR_2G445500v2 [Setaria viridis]